MKITTTLVHNGSGRAQIRAKATIDGKVRQKTISYDHGNSHDRNHGDAAGELLLANALDTMMREHLSKDRVFAATHTVVNGTTHTFIL